MKVVLLAGGLGTRMREETEFRPKPMVEVGGKPVLWHIMKTYASYGHTDFVICAGYKGDQIKQYFYNYAASNMDFTVTLGDADSAVFHGKHDEFGWRVTVSDTGFDTPTGGRIKAVEKYLEHESFLCTYGDGIANVDISQLLESHSSAGRKATITVTNPRSRFGIVQVENGNAVTGFLEKPETADPVNIGYFVFSPAIFDVLTRESVLEESPLVSLAAENQLTAFRHDGFWQPMDTFREYQLLNGLWQQGNAPWKIWGN
jgi:glucose-1-phosphate cytidylyltransferase